MTSAMLQLGTELLLIKCQHEHAGVHFLTINRSLKKVQHSGFNVWYWQNLGWGLAHFPNLLCLSSKVSVTSSRQSQYSTAANSLSSSCPPSNPWLYPANPHPAPIIPFHSPPLPLLPMNPPPHISPHSPPPLFLRAPPPSYVIVPPPPPLPPCALIIPYAGRLTQDLHIFWSPRDPLWKPAYARDRLAYTIHQPFIVSRQ